MNQEQLHIVRNNILVIKGCLLCMEKEAVKSGEVKSYFKEIVKRLSEMWECCFCGDTNGKIFEEMKDLNEDRKQMVD
jgi:hypothetical protein